MAWPFLQHDRYRPANPSFSRCSFHLAGTPFVNRSSDSPLGSRPWAMAAAAPGWQWGSSCQKIQRYQHQASRGQDRTEHEKRFSVHDSTPAFWISSAPTLPRE